MAESRATRGVPLPTVGQVLAIAAAFLAAWLVWSKYGRIIEGSDDARLWGSSGTEVPAVESYLNKGIDALPELMAALDSDDPTDRRRAEYSLGQIGPAAGEALETLLARLADDNPYVRAYAAYAVARIDPDKDSAAAAIAPLLADAQPAVREDAGKELLAIGSPAFKPVLKMLDSDDTSVRLTVVRTLRGTRDAVHYRGWRDREAEVLQTIRGLLNDVDPGVRDEALAVLAAWNQATAAEIGELLRNEDPQRIFIGLKAVVQLKRDAARLLPDIVILIDTLKLEEASAVRRRGVDERLLAVLSALTSLKTAARPAVPRLLKLSENSTSWTIIAIAQTLADIGADSEEIARLLVPLLLVETRRGPSISWRAGELLLKISPELGRRQVSLLIPRLPADDGTVDKSVLHALYALGPQAREAVPSLTPLLRDSDLKVVEMAAMTLGQVGFAAAQAAPELARVISNGARPVALRLVCAGALANVGAGARSTVPDLLQLISQGEPKSPLPATPDDASEWHVRAAIVRALGNIGGDDAGLVPALRTQLSSRSPNVRMAAAEAIGRAARQSKYVLADLVVRLRDGDPKVRATAALAIGRMTVERDTAVTPLIGLLLDDNRFVHSAAAVSLGNIGPAAGEALPLLREILADPPPTNFFTAEPSGNPDLDSLSFVSAVRTAIEAISEQSTASAR